jgi:hypothetical protein
VKFKRIVEREIGMMRGREEAVEVVVVNVLL